MGCASTKEPAVEPTTPLHSDKEDFEPSRAAENLHTHLQKDNEDSAVSSIQSLTVDQRTQLCDAYHKKYSTDLIAKCQEKSSESLTHFVMTLFLRSRQQNFVTKLRKLLKEEPVSEVTVLEVVHSLGDEELASVCALYRETYSCEVVDDVGSGCSEEVQKLLLARIQSEGSGENAPSEDEWAGRLVDAAGTNNLFAGDCLFMAVLKTNSHGRITEILEQFLQKCQRDITVEMEKFFPDDSVRTAYIITAQVIRMGQLYFAKTIQQLLKSDQQAQQRALLFWMLTQTEESMKDLKQCYRKMNLEILASDIKQDVQDPVIKRTLLKLVKEGC